MSKNWVLGADISNNNGSVSGTALAKAGVKYLWHKVSEGTFVDRLWTSNVESARRAGIRVGGYEFARPDRSGREQAKFFMDLAGPTMGWPHALDMETRWAGNTDWSLQWLEYVAEHSGRAPVLYANLTLFDRVDPALKRFALWLPSYTANYTPNPDPTKIPLPRVWPPYNDWQIWQYTSSGRIPGVHGDVDLNVCTQQHWLQQTNDMGPIGDDVETSVMMATTDGKYWELFLAGGVRRHIPNPTQLAAMRKLGIPDWGKIKNKADDWIVTRFKWI